MKKEGSMSKEVGRKSASRRHGGNSNSWGWFLGLGILLMLLGAICIIGDVTATFATVLVFGWLLLISGIVALVHAFGTRNWSGFFLNLPQRAVQRIHRIFADPLSARRSCKPHFDSCELLRCERDVSSNRGRNDEVSALGLGSFFRDRFRSAGSHAAGANATFEHLVHRFCNWC